MNNTNERAMRRLATATTLSRELTAYAWDAAVMEVSSKVKRKMKKLEGATVKPKEKQNKRSYSNSNTHTQVHRDHSLNKLPLQKWTVQQQLLKQ